MAGFKVSCSKLQGFTGLGLDDPVGCRGTARREGKEEENGGGGGGGARD